MKTYTLVNCYTAEVIEVKADFYEIVNQCRDFYYFDKEQNKLLKASYHARNWDVRNIENL
jgi:hypothetical protein